MRFHSMLNGGYASPFFKPDLTMRLCWQLLAVASFISATPAFAGPPDTARPVIPVATETGHEEPDIDMYALMSPQGRYRQGVAERLDCFCHSVPRG
jgi:hypothetical protein